MNLFKVPDRWEEMTEDEQLAWSGRVVDRNGERSCGPDRERDQQPQEDPRDS